LPNAGQLTGRGGPRCRLRPEVLVDLADRHRSLPDRGGHPFDRAAAHVARREHTGLAGFRVPKRVSAPVRDAGGSAEMREVQRSLGGCSL